MREGSQAEGFLEGNQQVWRGICWLSVSANVNYITFIIYCSNKDKFQKGVVFGCWLKTCPFLRMKRHAGQCDDVFVS